MADHVQPENMVVDLIGILVKATKGIDLVVSTIRDRGINKARGSLSQGPVQLEISTAWYSRFWELEQCSTGVETIFQ
jgi:hypothetical protein